MPNLISVKKYSKTYPVEIICPRCGKIRHEVWKQKPDMKNPRVACIICKPLFKQDEIQESTKGLSMRYSQKKSNQVNK